MEIHSILMILAQKSFYKPGDALDGQALAISGTGVVRGGWDWLQIMFCFTGNQYFFLNFGSKSFPVPGDAPDGQVWAISSIGGVRGGPYWYQIIYF